MATTQAQAKWRDKNRFVKRQLNVMARKLVHDSLDDIADVQNLKGKGEAVAFACFITQALRQQADFNDEAARLMTLFEESYLRDRDMYAD
ncbi:hypothetical protein [Magnetospira sp. QH-2]|uniref:hypothetical protein n=1 Tax=Magnetospira sp. (strain QH-2) TaxID=1288970 RepID=UPI0003E81AA8|nr:hypothetical protein [Magnetospira sp. QH-2]CCQ73794.1 Conserved protein of unknown function [Magnetospira sp. QH-2]